MSPQNRILWQSVVLIAVGVVVDVADVYAYSLFGRGFLDRPATETGKGRL